MISVRCIFLLACLVGLHDIARTDEDDSAATRRPGPSHDEQERWYCGVDQQQSRVLGPYLSVETAKQALASDTGSQNWLVRSYAPFVPKMVCEMTSCGAAPDPREINSWMTSSQALLWNNWDNVLEMNRMCEERCSEPPRQRPPWFCVSAQGNNNVWGPFTDIWRAKAEVWKASAGTRNICTMSEDGTVVDPNPRQDIGLTRSGRGQWWYWNAIKNMHKKCLWNQKCRQGPPQTK